MVTTRGNRNVLERLAGNGYGEYPLCDINQLKRGVDTDGIEDLHLVFCGFVICDETIIEGWDFGLRLAYYLGSGLNTDCRVGMGDNHAGYTAIFGGPSK
jgi:hypothetical protein